MKKSKLSILPQFGPFFACSDFFENGKLLWHFQVNWGNIDNFDFFMASQFHFSCKSPSILPKLTRTCHDRFPLSKKSLHAKNGPNRGKIENFDFFMASQFHFRTKSPSILPALTRKCHNRFPLSKKSLHAKNGPNRAKIDDFDFFMVFPLYFSYKTSPFLPK